MEEKITLGKFVAKKRKEANLTQRELADKLYVTESAVSKWERGVSYPDISLVSTICTALQISEHELITSSEDFAQRKIEKQAKSYQRFAKAYAWTFYAAYGIALITCFICNLAVNHTLSWFFIVLTAEMVAFSLTSLPQLLKSHKAPLTLAAFFVTLLILLLTCCIYTGGDWFGITAISLLFGFAVVFLPLLLRVAPLPGPLCKHKTLICFAAETILLFGLVLQASAFSGTMDGMWARALPSMLAGLAFPWALMLVIRYVRLNGLLRASICCFFSAVYMYFINDIMDFIFEGRPIGLIEFNLQVWSQQYFNGNIIVVTVLSTLLVAVFLLAGGIAITVKKAHKK